MTLAAPPLARWTIRSRLEEIFEQCGSVRAIAVIGVLEDHVHAVVAQDGGAVALDQAVAAEVVDVALRGSQGETGLDHVGARRGAVGAARDHEGGICPHAGKGRTIASESRGPESISCGSGGGDFHTA